jgi:hypothetical protein
MEQQDQLQEGSTMKSASPNQPQGLVLSRDAGRALDALIAEKVMGWRWRRGAHYDVSSVPASQQQHLLAPGESVGEQPSGEFTSIVEGDWPPADGRIIWNHMPEYSTDIAAAWLVVERMRADGWWPEVKYLVDWDNAAKWYAACHRPPHQWSATAATAPLAICRAALAALENSDA